MIKKIFAIIKFVTRDIWSFRLSDIQSRKAFYFRYLRVIILSIRKYKEDKLQFRASALTFYSMLSVVPLLAMGFGIAKGFKYDKYLEEQLRQNLEGHAEVLNYLLSFTESFLKKTQGGLIAGVGMVLLFWSVMRVFGNIESSFNDIWRIRKSRTFVRKFSDYFSMMLISPILIVTASSTNVFISTQLRTIDQRIAILGYLSPLIFFILKLAPYILIWVLFTLIYVIMPNIKVNLRSALIAGIIAGSIFQLTQWVYIHFQIGVSNYGAIYGSFAALPLFLMWMQISWLIVLFGAEISFSDQNIELYELETETTHISPYAKRIVSLLIAHRIIQNFKNGELPLNAIELSKELKLPIQLVRNILADLMKAHIVSEVNTEKPKVFAYQPAQYIERLSIKYVLNALDHLGHSTVIDLSLDKTIRLLEIHDSFSRTVDQHSDNVLLMNL
jgi:membrane protein